MPKSFNNCILLLLFSLVWLLMMVFSHEYVSDKINQNNQQQIKKIKQQAWDLNWPLLSKSELVANFELDWQWQDGALKSVVKNPQLSLNMNGYVIEPSIHQVLMIEAEVDDVIASEASFKLEFSNQQQKIYYQSKDLPVEKLNHLLDLNSLLWLRIDADGARSKGHNTAWAQLQVIDALVIRFYFPEAAEITLKKIQIKQTKAKRWTGQPEVNCRDMNQPQFACFITNQMRHLQNKQTLNASNQYVKPSSISDMPPIIWLISAALLVFWLLLFRFKFSNQSLLAFTIVFVAIGLLHQNWMAVYFIYLKWPLLVIFLVFIWYQRQCFKWPECAAIPVWISSVLIAFLFIILNWQAVEFSFFLDLPQYFLWAWLQQLLIGPLASDFMLKQLKISKWQVACVVGMLFSIIHAPNHVLMVATLFGGVAWSYAWLKYENIYANAFSQALLALVFYQVMPDAWLGTARIGLWF